MFPWRRPLLRENLVETGQFPLETLARSAPAVTPNEKVQLSQIGSPLPAFQMILRCVRCP